MSLSLSPSAYIYIFTSLLVLALFCLSVASLGRDWCGQVVREFADIHEDHINISRFANHSPFVFATSSFDRTVRSKRNGIVDFRKTVDYTIVPLT